MKHYCDEWIQEWCLENGWSDLYIEDNQYWAVRPGAFIPEPIPSCYLKDIKQTKGLSTHERYWLNMAAITTVISFIVTIYFVCPIFLLLALGIDSFTFASLEID